MVRAWLAVAVLAVAFCVGQSARAELIGVGLDWRSGIYAQEYWEKGNPHYLLVNLTKEPVEITVHDFDSKWRLGQPLPKAAAGPWKVAAGKTANVDAKPLLGGGLRRWMLVGKQPLGVLNSPTAATYDGPGIATSGGLNGSGGTVAGLFLVQPKLDFAAGAPAKVVLRVPTGVGTIKFKRQPEPSNDPLRPGSLAVEAVACDTLNVAIEEKAFVVDTSAVKGDAKQHQIVLTLAIPNVKSSELHMLDAWCANKMGGGQGITRAVWVVMP